MSAATDLITSMFFDEEYYLEEKTSALNVNSGTRWTTDSVLQAIEKAGMTPWEHYVKYGFHEINAQGTLGLDPSICFSTNKYLTQLAQVSNISVAYVAKNLDTDPLTDYAESGYALGLTAEMADEDGSFSHANRAQAYRAFYFNEPKYLQNKTDALNAQEETADWTVEKTAEAIEKAGMTPWQHFSRYGAFETDAQGNLGIDPGAYFDISRYYEDKMALLNAEGGGGWTEEDVALAFRKAKVDPVTHYAKYGLMEGLTPLSTVFSAVDGKTLTQAGDILSGDLVVDSLLSESFENWVDLNKVGSSQNNVIYYAFPSGKSLSDLHYDYKTQALTAVQKEAFQNGLDVVSQITGVRFEQTQNTDRANLLLFTATIMPERDDEGITLAWTDCLKVGSTLAIVLNDTALVPENANPVFGTEGYATILHEISHAMGLKHSFSGEDANLATLPSALENTAWSLMSYTNGSDSESWYVDGTQYYSPCDIVALNYLYGTDGLNGSEGVTYDGSGTFDLV